MDRQMTKLYAHRAATDPTYKCRRIMRKRSWRNGARLPGSKRSGRWRPRCEGLSRRGRRAGCPEAQSLIEEMTLILALQDALKA